MTENEDVTKKPENEPLDDEALEKSVDSLQLKLQRNCANLDVFVYSRSDFRLAVEELMREAVQGAARAEIVGPSGWIKAPQQKTNKRFLVNTIRNAVTSNKYHHSRSHRSSSRRSPKRERHTEPTISKDRSKRKH